MAIQTVGFGFNFVIDILVGIMSLFIAYYSYKAHKLTHSPNFGYFSLGFLSLCASFILKSFAMFIFSLDAVVVSTSLTFHSYSAAILLTNFFRLLGFILILFATKDIKNNKFGKIMIYLFMLILVISLSSIMIFYAASLFILLIISYYYFDNSINNNNKNGVKIFISMLLIFLGQLMYLFVPLYSSILQGFIFLLAFTLLYETIVKAYRVELV